MVISIALFRKIGKKWSCVEPLPSARVNTGALRVGFQPYPWPGGNRPPGSARMNVSRQLQHPWGVVIRKIQPSVNRKSLKKAPICGRPQSQIPFILFQINAAVQFLHGNSFECGKIWAHLSNCTAHSRCLLDDYQGSLYILIRNRCLNKSIGLSAWLRYFQLCR